MIANPPVNSTRDGTSAGLKLQISVVSAGICPAGLPKQIELLGVSSSSMTKINTILAANRRSVCLTASFQLFRALN